MEAPLDRAVMPGSAPVAARPEAAAPLARAAPPAIRAGPAVRAGARALSVVGWAVTQARVA